MSDRMVEFELRYRDAASGRLHEQPARAARVPVVGELLEFALPADSLLAEPTRLWCRVQDVLWRGRLVYRAVCVLVASEPP